MVILGSSIGPEFDYEEKEEDGKGHGIISCQHEVRLPTLWTEIGIVVVALTFIYQNIQRLHPRTVSPSLKVFGLKFPLNCGIPHGGGSIN